jgi:hypothetical protein
MSVDFSHLAPLRPEKTNVGVGLAFFELLHIRGAIFGGEKGQIWPVNVPGRAMWACGGRLLARIS